MQQSDPRRIVFRFPVTYELEEAAIVMGFFGMFGRDPQDDYFSHLMAPNESSTKMHIILDMHCKTVPEVNLDDIEYEVFKVKKNNEL
ncbi:hypothetical protein LTS13_008095 [Exophiala xenobiotica]|nr:hypothetical protein LTS06_008039 [Exophiala xenobiotica]KAK5283501.1 hypothetical protein LTR40_001644 [Exophiala xenobiotica]KAK5367242.1 hypothetical protein LTS13_008095 [Exophiala xenobiotica]KAK5405954.1 hypothetical protein LTR90_010765 [Exophiala xenobiotica]KAK5506550.1 hypothetical protein LTR83_001103 [Exophiala xenobiotica]